MNERVVRSAAARAFRRWARILSRVAPGADIQHVGATAVHGSLTKGDLDISVRVLRAEFSSVEARMATRLNRNDGSSRTPSFAAFEADDVSIAIGVQLSVIGSPDDVFVAQRDLLLHDAGLRGAYDALKRAHHGRPHEEYRAAKERFWSMCRARTES